MSYYSYFLKSWTFILALGLIFSLGSFGVNLVQPSKFEASTKLLVIQKGQEKFDPYSASKSAENLSSVLKQIVFTNSFFNRVIEAKYNIEDTFGSTEEKQMKAWSKTVQVEGVKDTGILNVSVFHRDRAQAEQIAHAIANVLVVDGKEYHGGGNNIIIRIIDAPRVSEKTTVPKTAQNTVIGGLLGLSVAILILFARYESGKQEPLHARQIFMKNNSIEESEGKQSLESDELIAQEIAQNLKTSLENHSQ